MSRLRDVKATVLYPAEVSDDADISETGVRFRPEKVSFLQGWNFCTDLYRLIDHTDAMIKLRQEPPNEEHNDTITSFLSRQTDPSDFASKSLALVSALHVKLPKELKRVTAMTGDAHQDRLGFVGKSQINTPNWRHLLILAASNVLITTQTLKMILVGIKGSSVHQQCSIASELLDELTSVPLDVFRASSTCSVCLCQMKGPNIRSMLTQDQVTPSCACWLPTWQNYLQSPLGLGIFASAEHTPCPGQHIGKSANRPPIPIRYNCYYQSSDYPN